MLSKKLTFKMIKVITCLILFAFIIDVNSQDVNSMDRQADAYFEKKDFSKAIALWLNILDIDPENIKVEKKIERLYDLKQKKDMSLQLSKINYKIAKKTLIKVRKLEESKPELVRENLDIVRSRSKISFKNFIIAYRIDPKDPEFKQMKEDMIRLEKEVEAELEKERLSSELRAKNIRLRKLAKSLMVQEKFEEAIKYWKEILSFLPSDKIAKEGFRSSRLAIDNRVKFERIKNFTANGKKLYDENKFKLARVEFLQILALDSENGNAKDYIELIDEKLNAKREYETRRLQAEDFYQSGIKSIVNNNFDLAIENFQSALALIDNYKDSETRLKGIKKLRAEYENRMKAIKLQRISQLFQNGIILLSEGKYKESISALEKTITLDPNNKLAKEYITRAKNALKLVEEERVDSDSPYFIIIQSLIISGKRLYNRGNYIKSKKKWVSILNLFPKNKIATEFTFKCDIKLNPGAYDIFIGRIINEGKAFLKKKNYKSALKKFELIASVKQDYMGINNLLATAKRGLEKRVKKILFGAKKQENIGRPINRIETNNRYRAGMRLYRLGGQNNIRKALVELRWVARNDPANIKAIISVNKIETQLRIGARGINIRKKRLTQDQMKLARKFYYRGINFYSNNNFKRAINSWRKVLAIDPYHVKAKNNIRKVIVFLGR